MIQFEPMYDTIGERIYPEPELPLEADTVYYARSSWHGGVSKQFRGTIKEKVFNKLNGRWAYKLSIDRHWDLTKVHDETWWAFDDLITSEDKVKMEISNGK